MAKRKQIIGVVGAAGDLGSQLEALLEVSGHQVKTVRSRTDTTMSIAELMEECDIVHFCIPAHTFKTMPSVKQGQIVVLHDSVMTTSVRIGREYFDDNANHVHMLMNERKTVVMNTLNPDQAVLTQHFTRLGLQPVTMSPQEHDYIMSRSQAPLVLLVALLLPHLDEWEKQGVLTPSGSALLGALEARAAQWTPATIDALFANPELNSFIDDLRGLVERKGQHYGK